MNVFPIPYIFFFAANLIFIVSALICGYFRWVHICPEYANQEFLHYPARKPAIIICMMLALDFPYLINVFSSDALLYSNVYSILAYPIFIVVMIKRYFFYTHFSAKYLFRICFVPTLILVPLFVYAIYGGNELEKYHRYILLVSLLIGSIQFFWGLWSIYHFFIATQSYDEQFYSNTKDFPIKFGKEMMITIPILFFVSVILPSLISTPWAKFFRDLGISIFNVWAIGSTLGSNRPLATSYYIWTRDEKIEVEPPEEASANEGKNLLIDDIVSILVNDKLYKQPSLMLDDLVTAVHSNRKYVSQAISESQYGSFYRLVNSIRVIKACSLKEENPSIKQEDLALSVGFNSRFVLSRWMKLRNKGELPRFDDNIIMKLNEK